MNIRINIGITPYKQKPTNGGRVNNELVHLDAVREIGIDDFCRLVAHEGHPFTMAQFGTLNQDGNLERKLHCFSSQQLIAIDIDNKGTEYKTLEETVAHCCGYGLFPFLAYQTYSSTCDHQKYRLVFKLSRPIYSIREAEILTSWMTELVPWADPACKDVTHYFYGSISGPVNCYGVDPGNTITPEEIVLAWIAAHTDSDRNRSHKIKSVASQYGIVLQNNLPKLYLPPHKEQCGDRGEDEVQNNANSHAPYINYSERGKALKSPLSPDTDLMVGGPPETVFEFSIPFATYLSNQHRCQSAGAKSVSYPLVKQKTEKQRPQYSWQRHGADIMNGCELVRLQQRELEEENDGIHHNEFFHMATALINIEGGAKQFLKWIEACGYQVNKRRGQISVINRYCYRPQRCVKSGCRYLSTCQHAQTDENATILGLAYKRGEVLLLEKPITVPLDQVRSQIPELFARALNSDNRYSVIRVDCGAGKTYHMNPIMLECLAQGQRVIYAAPTHRLLEETWKGLIEEHGCDQIYKIPDLTSYIAKRSPALAAQIEMFWCTGQNEKASREIIRWAKQQDCEHEYKARFLNGELENSDKEGLDIANYLHAIANKDSDDPAIFFITHARLVFAKIKADVTFIDEDIIYRNLITCGSVRISDLKRLLTLIETHDHKSVQEQQKAMNLQMPLRRLIKTMQEANPDQIIDIPQPHDFRYLTKIEELPLSEFYSTKEDDPGASKVFDFLGKKTLAFIKPSYMSNSDTIYFVQRHYLPKDLGKIIMTSATANETVCQSVFSELLYIDTPTVSYEGKLYCYPAQSLSNRWLQDEKNDAQQEIKSILERHPIEKLICTKKMAGSLPAEAKARVACTYGATDGFNETKGQDHVVLGILHRPPHIYRLFAHALGIKDTTDGSSNYRSTTRNGFRFHFYAFDSERLREIQFYFVETELQQAIGRARLAENDCTVHLYTNLPLPQSIIQRVS